MNAQSCAFTGHRPAKLGFDDNGPCCLNLKTKLVEEIEKLIQAGVTTFYSGLALGTDQWAAQAVLALKGRYPHIRLQAVLPCANQAKLWTSQEREQHTALVAECDEVEIISPVYTPACMFQRNRRLVDQADHILAVYDGSSKGGTSYTVNYARRRGKPITVINPDTNEIAFIAPTQTLCAG